MTDSSPKCLRMLNLGCGSTFHPDWINIDFHDHGGAIMAYDLRLGIPFAENTFDIVYHSHVLEHFSKDAGRKFIAECFRVLKPGGLLRVAAPDLENIAAAYLKAAREARNGEAGAAARHEWMTIELIDQMTRREQGGEMLRYWQRNPIPQEEFMLSRAGHEARTYMQRFREKSHHAQHKSAPPIAGADYEFLAGGGLHRWMYDEISLSALLAESGFSGVARKNYNESARPEILAYGLDVDSEGNIRKPDSFFMEAVKPAQQAKSPRLLILSSSDAGGAGIAALRLHKALESTGIASQMFVASQNNTTRNLHIFPAKGQSLEISPTGSATLSGYSSYGDKRKITVDKNYPQHGWIEYFTTPGQCADLRDLPFVDDFDVINLNWISGFIDPAMHADFFKDRPLIWTMHDMNPFTGGCHYSGACEKFTEHCGACPQLGSDDEKDLSFQIWRSRMSVYRKLNLHIVAPSRWLAQQAEKSSLFNRFPVHVIPHALPLGIFRPLNRDAIRRSLGMEADDFVMCFSAQNLTNNRKGASYMLEALKMLAQTTLRDKARCLLLGNNPPKIFFELGIKADAVGHIRNEEQMAMLYNAADVVIAPSLQDNSPNVICEAAACGTPVAAFACGGIPEMIVHESTGWLAPVQDAAGLMQGLLWAEREKQDKNLRLRCRALALEKWNPAARAVEYTNIFMNATAR